MKRRIGRGGSPGDEAPAAIDGAVAILQFKIWLKGLSPMIWRRVQVSVDTTHSGRPYPRPYGRLLRAQITSRQAASTGQLQSVITSVSGKLQRASKLPAFAIIISGEKIARSPPRDVHVAALDAEITSLIAEDTVLVRRHQILASIVGVETLTANQLIAAMPKVGSLENKQAASVASLPRRAPVRAVER